MSKLRPSVFGAKRFCVPPHRLLPADPKHSVTATSRVKPSAGSRYARPAGTMESRKGRATDAPVPRRKVRRERCFPVMKFMVPPGCLRDLPARFFLMLSRHAFLIGYGTNHPL